MEEITTDDLPHGLELARLALLLRQLRIKNYLRTFGRPPNVVLQSQRTQRSFT